LEADDGGGVEVGDEGGGTGAGGGAPVDVEAEEVPAFGELIVRKGEVVIDCLVVVVVSADELVSGLVVGIVAQPADNHTDAGVVYFSIGFEVLLHFLRKEYS
jgi:hypothetical protein